MKKFFSILFVLAAVASLRADAYQDRYRFLVRMESCEAILRETQADPARAIPPEIMHRAKALVITNQGKFGAGIGLQSGYGVILVKKANGSWSIPVVIRAGETSLGLQFGGSRIETVYVIMDEQTPRLLFEGRVNFGVDAAAVAGPHASEIAKASKDLLKVPVQVYSNKKGLFLGATIKSGYISRSDEINRAYYEVDYDLPELLYGNFVKPPFDVRPLMEFVTQLSP